MSLENFQAGSRSEFNLTASSTVQHLLAVGATCLVLWTVIGVTIGF